jgi:RimJ/RimL family protein N-acetyltransferase
LASSEGLDLTAAIAGVSLSEISLVDAPSMLPYFSSPDVCRYIPWEPRDISGVEEFIKTKCSIKPPQQDGEFLVLGIRHSELGLVGQVNIAIKSSLTGWAEFGYVLNPDFVGQGFATAGSRLLASLAFNQLGVRRLTAYIDERNKPSIAVVERLGMRLEAREVDVEQLKGEFVTMLRFAALSREWPEYSGQ